MLEIDHERMKWKISYRPHNALGWGNYFTIETTNDYGDENEQLFIPYEVMMAFARKLIKDATNEL